MRAVGDAGAAETLAAKLQPAQRNRIQAGLHDFDFEIGERKRQPHGFQNPVSIQHLRLPFEAETGLRVDGHGVALRQRRQFEGAEEPAHSRHEEPGKAASPAEAG